MANETKKTSVKKPAAKKPSTRKSASQKTSTEKTSVKKPVTKKPAAKKVAVKKPAAKKPAVKKPVSSNPIPRSMSERKASGTVNLENSMVTNKNKVKKKVSKKTKLNGEKIFWLIIAILFVAFAIFSVAFVFNDYTKDSSTPAQKEAKKNKISKADIDYLKSLGTEDTRIEKVEFTDEGPILYMIYTVPAGTVRDEITAAISEYYKRGLEEKPELFKKHSIQITVVCSGDEAEGVDDYPIIGAINAGNAGVSWMRTDGNFQNPVEEESSKE